MAAHLCARHCSRTAPMARPRPLPPASTRTNPPFRQPIHVFTCRLPFCSLHAEDNQTSIDAFGPASRPHPSSPSPTLLRHLLAPTSTPPNAPHVTCSQRPCPRVTHTHPPGHLRTSYTHTRAAPMRLAPHGQSLRIPRASRVQTTHCPPLHIPTHANAPYNPFLASPMPHALPSMPQLYPRRPDMC